jgi:hypothetical protein
MGTGQSAVGAEGRRGPQLSYNAVVTRQAAEHRRGSMVAGC